VKHPAAPLAAALALGGLLLAPSAVPATVGHDGFTAVRTGTPLALDAKFADPRWASAFVDDGMVDLGVRGPAPSRTSVAIFYDDANLYVGFKVQQTASLVASQRTDNVGFGSDDFVGLGVDSAGDVAGYMAHDHVLRQQHRAPRHLTFPAATFALQAGEVVGRAKQLRLEPF